MNPRTTLPVRHRVFIAVETAVLMFRVWKLSRRTGIPFQPLLDAHLEMMQQRARCLHEAVVAEIAKRN